MPSGQPAGDQIATLLDLRADPARVPAALTLRELGGTVGAPGEGKYMINRYLRERGDANITSNADLITKARFYAGPELSGPQAGARAGGARHGARHRRPRPDAVRAADDAAAVHAGAAAGRAGGADGHGAAAKADVAARAGGRTAARRSAGR